LPEPSVDSPPRPWRSVFAVRDWPLWALPGWLACLVVTVILAALAAIAAGAFVTAWHVRDVELFGLLMGCGLVTVELTRRSGEPGGAFKDVDAVWDLPAAILLPPVYVLIAPIPRLLLAQWRTRQTLIYRRAFTGAAIGLSYAAASVVFHEATPVLAHAAHWPGGRATAWALLAIACGLLRVALNDTLVMTAVKGADPAAKIRPLVFGREPLYNNLAELCMAVLVAFAAARDLFLVPIAVPLVILLQRSLRHAHLLGASRIDGKTGLLNAATWQQEAAVEVTRANRTRTPVAVAIADIDHFKQVNDTYGHLTGDAVLAGLARALQALLRDYDLTCRFGGEEFAILLPQTTAWEAYQIAERLRESLSRIPIPTGDAADEHGVLTVTVSIGVAAVHTSRRDLTDLLATADAALYAAKRSGRNAVRLADEPALSASENSPHDPAGDSAAG
jgi:diguanylate cyclase (GGDEF)-like protein